MRRSASALALMLALAFSLAHVAQAATWLRSWDAHGRPFDLRSLRGKVVALTFGGRHTQDEVTEVNDELAQEAGRDFQVLCVVDLTEVPGVGRGGALKKIAEADRPGELEHLVDDHGSLRRPFEVSPDERVDILILDKNGDLRARYVGLREVPDALKKIAELRAE
jgi:hypothetical protein